MDGVTPDVLGAWDRRDLRRWALLLGASLALHLLALSWLSLRPGAARVTAAPPLQIVLEPAAPRTAEPKATLAPKAGGERAPEPPRLDLGLDNPLRPTPRPLPPDEARRPIASARGGSSGAGATIETRFGTIETYKVGGETTVRYTFSDGRIRCFFIRDPDLNKSFDIGAVLVGPGC